MALKSETVETLEAAALQLTPADRARLVDRLIATLDADPEVEETWAAEVERRQTEMENGTVTLLSGPENLAELKAEFKRTTPCTRSWKLGVMQPTIDSQPVRDELFRRIGRNVVNFQYLEATLRSMVPTLYYKSTLKELQARQNEVSPKAGQVDFWKLS